MWILLCLNHELVLLSYSKMNSHSTCKTNAAVEYCAEDEATIVLGKEGQLKTTVVVDVFIRTIPCQIIIEYRSFRWLIAILRRRLLLLNNSKHIALHLCHFSFTRDSFISPNQNGWPRRKYPFICSVSLAANCQFSDHHLPLSRNYLNWRGETAGILGGRHDQWVHMRLT